MYIRRPDCDEPLAVSGWCGHLHLQVWSLPLTSAAHIVAVPKLLVPFSTYWCAPLGQRSTSFPTPLLWGTCSSWPSPWAPALPSMPINGWMSQRGWYLVVFLRNALVVNCICVLKWRSQMGSCEGDPHRRRGEESILQGHRQHGKAQQVSPQAVV